MALCGNEFHRVTTLRLKKFLLISVLNSCPFTLRLCPQVLVSSTGGTIFSISTLSRPLSILDNGRHLGVDVICKEGSVIYAPFNGKLIRRANPYNNGNEIDNGVMLRGSDRPLISGIKLVNLLSSAPKAITVLMDSDINFIVNFQFTMFMNLINFNIIVANPANFQISKGQRLGTLLNVQAVFPEITSHVHIEMCDTSINPTPNL
eukprot:g40429.t1